MQVVVVVAVTLPLQLVVTVELAVEVPVKRCLKAQLETAPQTLVVEAVEQVTILATKAPAVPVLSSCVFLLEQPQHSLVVLPPVLALR